MIRQPGLALLHQLAVDTAEQQGPAVLRDWIGLGQILYAHGLPFDVDTIVQFGDLIRAEFQK